MIRTISRVLAILVVALPLASCGGAKTNPKLIDLWETGEKNKRCSLEFTKEGKLLVSGEMSLLKEFQFVPKLLIEFNMQPGMNSITYKAVSEKEVEIQGNYTSLIEKLSAGADKVDPEQVKKMMNELQPVEHLTYAISEKELTLTNSQGKTLRLKKVE